jgi:molybdopterin-guanine dinucleotide biosynthesis adapter protein
MKSFGDLPGRDAAPPVVTVVGYSDSGKTTVVSSLIRILAGDGFRVASVKHSPHGHESDRPGSDTYRHRQAGAALVVASSPGSLTAFERVDRDMPLEAIVESIGEGIDIVIAEGFKTSTYHKVLVSESLPVPENVDSVVATVGRAAHLPGVPEFDLDTIHLLAEMIRERFLGQASS